MFTDIAVHLGGGIVAMLKCWLIHGEDPSDPEAFTDRTLRVSYFFVPAGETSAALGRREP
ncbi:MAG TPA: hypothetical protein VKI00_27095 [Mycobacterium sp.]|uniref:hypothetical protein n=1 Tax=Mycobacterium sp. TaxID=1785 RepID=UPI002B737292|nr:hypothetical protein [Mycobacterium sp.]HME79190.1 hypothetical protein [Mycobacterium sp.]